MVHLLDTCTSTRAVNEVVGPMTGSSSRREISYSKVETSAVNVRTCMDAYAASSKPGLVRRLASHVAYLRTFVHTTLYGSTFVLSYKVLSKVLCTKVRKYFRTTLYVRRYEGTRRDSPVDEPAPVSNLLHRHPYKYERSPQKSRL